MYNRPALILQGIIMTRMSSKLSCPISWLISEHPHLKISTYSMPGMRMFAKLVHFHRGGCPLACQPTSQGS